MTFNTLRISWAFACVLVVTITAHAQDSRPADAKASGASESPQSHVTPPVIMHLRSMRARNTGIGQALQVEIDSLPAAISRDHVDPRNFILYLGGYPIWNARSESVLPWRGALEFRLERADTSRNAWVSLLGRPTSLVRRDVRVGVGYGSNPEIEPVSLLSPPTVNLIVADGWRLVVGAVVVLGLLASFWSFAKRSNIIRDSSPPDPPLGKNRPYSLARLQMAVWFFLVLGSFVFLYIITGELNTLNEQALMLIGIGTATALGAAVVDGTKGTTSAARLAELRPARARLKAEIEAPQQPTGASVGIVSAGGQPALPTVDVAGKKEELAAIEKELAVVESTQSSPVSEGLFTDLLTDAGGISFHRFQMLAWTIVLGLVFIYGVWERLAMPQFSGTLLALLGISAGTYLGFKVPERQG